LIRLPTSFIMESAMVMFSKSGCSTYMSNDSAFVAFLVVYVWEVLAATLHIEEFWMKVGQQDSLIPLYWHDQLISNQECKPSSSFMLLT
jgi:hypothetical protein